jgi:hypothetical protein
MIPGIVSLQSSGNLVAPANCDENITPCDNSSSPCDDVPCNCNCDCYDSGDGEDDDG